MNIIAWIILGLLVGAIAKAISPGRQGGGIVGTMFLGIIGALIGGSLGVFLQTGTFQLVATSLTLGGIFLAVLGAVIALFLWSLLTRQST
uniref:GlsB/YeaQ/YmgE family stress response membrane protein n=1 Tax=Trichocoleus desertorum TaxID=1481672 RepID=UPI0025B5EF9F|nr:GlsB/YeaQ/YmgE family stress response membrane protein [Trichocoleus desertorum]